MQDFEPLTGWAKSVDRLIAAVEIRAQTTKFNKDHFVKRGVTERFVRTARRWRCSRCSLTRLRAAKAIVPGCAAAGH